MKEHELKTWPTYFQAIRDGEKFFEYRYNDRGFEKGDILVLREWNPITEEYSGEKFKVRVESVWQGLPELPRNFCIMDIE
jgi:hypothetical protein